MTAPAATTCELRPRGGLTVLTWPMLDGLGADVAVTTRRGGVSAGPYDSLNLSFSVADDPAAVRQNRLRLAAALGTDLGDFVFARQVHAARAEVVSAGDRGRGTLGVGDAVPDADALVTSDPGTVLAILVGDCVPIVLLDPVAGVLACVHAGWRGTVAGVTAAALAAMGTLGTRPAAVLAGVGPAIAPDRYQVGDEVAEQVRAAFGGDAAGLLSPDGTGRWLLDLWAANRRALIEAGVPDQQVQVAAVPTGPGIAMPGNPAVTPAGPASDPRYPGGPGGQAEPDQGLFFSDRTARPCGRFALVARLGPGNGLAPEAGRPQRDRTQQGRTQQGRTQRESA
jgi:polyphenol oxidase